MIVTNRRTDCNLNAIAEASRCHAVENTKKVYDRVERELTAFCNWIKDHDPQERHAPGTNEFPTHIESRKVYDFMFYQCFRKKQERPGGIGGGVSLLTFNGLEQYEEVKREYWDAYKKWQADPTGNPIPDPEDGGGVWGVGISAIMHYSPARELVTGINSKREVD